MLKVDVLDYMPQWRQDYANHIAYGGLATVLLAVLILAFSHILGAPFSALRVRQVVAFSCHAVMCVGVVKKVLDYVLVGPPTESVWVCVSKAVVTAFWPGSFLILMRLI